MKGSDSFQKQSNRRLVVQGNPAWSLRLKTLLNLIVHILFAALYAFEHKSQVTVRNQNDSVETTAASATALVGEEEEVYTPAGNFIIVGLNIVLAALVVQITLNIDRQIEHIFTPRFMPQQLHVKASYRYRNMYWGFSFFVVLLIMVKERGLTVVEHGFFVLISLCLLSYAPFWLSKAINGYEEQVQESEIAAIDRQALQCLEQMSLSYRSSSQVNQEEPLDESRVNESDTLGNSQSQVNTENQFNVDQASARCSLASTARPTAADEEAQLRMSMVRRTRRTSPGKIYIDVPREERKSFTAALKGPQLDSTRRSSAFGPRPPSSSAMSLSSEQSRSSFRHQMLLTSPRLGFMVPQSRIPPIPNQSPDLVTLNQGETNVQHQILSRRNVESLTYLQEEDSYPSYERNEDDAFVSSTMQRPIGQNRYYKAPNP